MTRALAVLRTPSDARDPETELATVSRHGTRLQLNLDDGQILDFDAWELIGAAAAAADEQPGDDAQAAA